MKMITVSANEAGQRIDKLLAKYLREAPRSFLYKMMRKKNITLNGKKVQGSEILQEGDAIRLFFSEDTLQKFEGKAVQVQMIPKVRLSVIYEDEHILLINKPAGMLSQKSQPRDVSLVEYVISYLLEIGSITEETLKSFRPAVCNRLDRNTSGLVIAGKSLAGLQTMSSLLKDRSMKKYYRCIVKGTMQGSRHLKGYLVKDEKTNTVQIQQTPHGDAKMIETEYRVLAGKDGLSLLEVHLITGRSHQIRAHLASIGHPVLGDVKYGDQRLNERYRRSHQITCQLLHAYRLELPVIDGKLDGLSEKVFCAPMPGLYRELVPFDE